MELLRVFFSYTHADEVAVDFIYRSLVEREPAFEGWIDRYEFAGGEQMLREIGEAMDRADRFLVFLSPRSVDSEWVRRELRRALTLEIQGMKPNFVVPVLIEAIERLPEFLEDKYYVDLRGKSEDEALQRLAAAVRGEALPSASAPENLMCRPVVRGNMLELWFEPRAFDLPASFGVEATEPILEKDWDFPGRSPFSGMVNVAGNDFRYLVTVPGYSVQPGRPMRLTISFEEDVVPLDAIKSVGPVES